MLYAAVVGLQISLVASHKRIRLHDVHALSVQGNITSLLRPHVRHACQDFVIYGFSCYLFTVVGKFTASIAPLLSDTNTLEFEY